jgi:hypothetical protein
MVQINDRIMSAHNFFSFIGVLGGGTLWHLQRFLQCIRYIILGFTPSSSPLSPSPLIHGIVTTGITIPMTCMYRHFFLHCSHPHFDVLFLKTLYMHVKVFTSPELDLFRRGYGKNALKGCIYLYEFLQQKS